MNSDTSHKALKVILYSQLLVEAIDDIKGTPLYKQKSKSILNNVERILKDNIKLNDDIYSSDPEMVTNLFNILDTVVSKLAQKDIVEISMINQIHDTYMKNPKAFEGKFKIQMTKIDT